MQFESGSALVKVIVVAAVALFMLIPLAMLRGLIFERSMLQDAAVKSVTRGWGGRQLVGGPVIVVPVALHTDQDKWETRNCYLLPEEATLDATIAVQSERRKVGVYEVPVYLTTLEVRARFDLARQLAKFTANATEFRVYADHARLLVPVGDLRGVRSIAIPNMELGGALEPVRGFPIAALGAPVAFDPSAKPLDVEVRLEVAGTEALEIVPLARSFAATLKGNWPHPGFAIGLLPLKRRVSDQGFEARWRALDLNRSYGMQWFEGQTTPEELQASAFGVELIQPVDLYQMITRSVKYAGLFVSLSLLTLFVFERLTQRALHPIEYGLMALALAVFYLLLLALAEHIGFTLAYLLAALALCMLLGVYLAGVLRSRRAGTGGGGLFAAVYGLLYLLVRSEDFALLAGALALFVLLASAMLLTRKVNWYGGESQSQQEGRLPSARS